MAAAPTPKPSAEAWLRRQPLVPAPIPGRTTPALPSASEAPPASHRASTFVPLRVEPVLPPASLATPVPLNGAGPTWPGMGEALNLTRGPGGQKRILLSFDGGSSAEVATEVLDLLKARGVHTTLFLTGAFIQRFPALVRRMAAEGHELGNHTMNHPHFAPGMRRDPKWTRERIQRELLDADAALVRLLGRPMDPFWRAPYGEHTAEIRRWAEELGYRHVGWSEGADTLDWATPRERRLYRTGDAIVARLQQRLGRDGDGLIVLMHLGSARELGDRPTLGLGAFMDRARKEGWSFVSAGTILHDLGKPAWDPHQRLALLTGSRVQGR
jgi:peptidoglycan/xylan/chitin deacetylase (PgdA/CDA1 family)